MDALPQLAIKSRMRIICWTFSMLILFMVGCEIKTEPTTDHPKRPSNLPQAAFWVGGADGGVFVELQKSPENPPHIYQAGIYYETTGEVWYQGRLSVEPSEQPDVDIGNPELFSGWDGEALLLTDNRQMRAIDKIEKD